MTEKKKVYSLRLPDDGIVSKWISNQKNVTASISQALLLIASKYGTEEIMESVPQYQARLEKFNEDLISDNSALRKELNAVKQQLRNQGITPVTPEPPVTPASTPAPVVPKSSKNTTGDQNNGPDVDMSFLSKQ